MPTQNLHIALVPTSEDFQIIDVFMGGSGILEPDDLKSLKVPAEIQWNKGVVINGRTSTWVFSALTHLCHPAAWVAVYAPRDGGAIVVQSHRAVGPYVGEVVPSSRIQPYIPRHIDIPKPPQDSPQTNKAAVAFLGPPHSGKSILLNELRLALRQHLPEEIFQREFFILRACPDGQGDWFDDIPQSQAMTLRYKNRFDSDFVSRISNHLRQLRSEKSLLFVDCGGKIDKKNTAILDACTHAIIVSSDPGLFERWMGAVEAGELGLLAQIESTTREEVAVVSQSPLRIRIGKLERGNKTIRLPTELIDAVANLV